ncbi:MAG: hypothetical protein QXE20_03740 [Acidilobaceae archaeon]
MSEANSIGSSLKNWKVASIEALSKIRALQLKIRIAMSRPNPAESKDYAVKLETLSEVLERVALRLETAIYTGIASEAIAESLTVFAIALYKLKRGLPPSLQHEALTIWGELAEISKSMAPDLFPNAFQDALEEDAERVLREAEEEVKRRLERGQLKR